MTRVIDFIHQFAKHMEFYPKKCNTHCLLNKIFSAIYTNHLQNFINQYINVCTIVVHYRNDRNNAARGINSFGQIFVGQQNITVQLL